MAVLGTLSLNAHRRADHNHILTATDYDAMIDAVGAAIQAAYTHVDALTAAKTLVITSGAKQGATGTTSGWVVEDALDQSSLAKLAASSTTASTLVVPITGLFVGQTITGYTVRGQIECTSGNDVTLDCALWSATIAAGDVAHAAVASGGITQVAETTADAIIAASVTGLTAAVTAGVTYYFLLTGTTAASTDIDLASIDVTIAAT
jgi:hypothetical protein